MLSRDVILTNYVSVCGMNICTVFC